MIWQFDESVAKRFQHEAITNIPDYERVISLCIDIVNNNYPKETKIVDVGSALGYTMDRFIQNGYTNVCGIESSQSMIDQSLHKERIIKSESFVGNYNVVLMNWTLHFIKDKWKYVDSIYESLDRNGILILTDKTNQSGIVKEIYYNFKRNNNISDEYIYEKESKLKGYMFTEDVSSYLANLKWIGFNVEIINASCGFVTFLCSK